VSADEGGLAARWNAAWRALGLPAPDGLGERLLACYDEPHRYYHTRRHLAECLATAGSLAQHALHPHEIALALFFHDAVYDTRRHDNEVQSAGWAQRAMLDAGGEAGAARRIESLVLATRHAASPDGADEEVLVDADLAILGAPPARFDEYERQVRCEYAWVDADTWRRERRRVLESFRARTRIFATPTLHATHEAAARSNLERALERL
jgi:predicted metal-dependent HD superfamily phosphohydrolase